MKLPNRRPEVLFIPNAVKCENIIDINHVGDNISIENVDHDNVEEPGIIRTEIMVDDIENGGSRDGFHILLEAAELGDNETDSPGKSFYLGMIVFT